MARKSRYTVVSLNHTWKELGYRKNVGSNTEDSDNFVGDGGQGLETVAIGSEDDDWSRVNRGLFIKGTTRIRS